ncbi:MAG: 5-formyltetrahydrofolate cyclo-ligase [Lamprobacter sp.]|uniref:5-formyltetrahydrofolate cyclo-ligase n=1 Tax=Lamprobacter sp. TaxID=3100796 RepID=UPI002B25F721|nr:5-formyltetrahydrofolate cyclo-ligase [Lamprobacter sp.]MEA3639647.1 5-formyltetrahydrofolate cyclo-ligase [Lamprobacter sp.]
MTDPLLRRRLRRARRALTQPEQREHAEAVCQRLISSGLLHAARRIAFYLPLHGELNPMPIRERLPGRRRWYLPVLRQHAPGRLWFVRFDAQSRLQRNRFGILEPVVHQRRIVPPQGLNLILVPLVGFDAECHRIGMGAGFYDRSLAFLGSRQHWQRPRLIGLAHECQRVEAIEPEPWDRPMDAIVTEQALYRRAIQSPDEIGRALWS